MQKRLWVLLLGLFLLAACSQNEANDKEKETSSENEVKALNVELTTSPEADSIKVGEEFSAQAKVTYGEESVNDAKEVRFEFWKEGQPQDDHEMIEGEFQKDGTYTMTKTVNEPGVYYVISHVTARGMHNMPQKKLVIGNPNMNTEENHKDHNQDSHDEEGHGGHGHGSGVMTHIMVDEEQMAGEEVKLMGHLMQEDKPLEGANVRFEIWKTGEEKHQFIDLTYTGKEGKYTAPFTFNEEGSYQLKIHVNKGELHTHKTKEITVK